MVEIDKLTIGEAKQLASIFSTRACDDTEPWQIGTAYHIRTVTQYFTGRLTQVTRQELVLEDAAWIADAGRFADALTSGSVSEVEPYPTGKVIIGRGSIVDACEWSHDLPRDQK